MNIFANRFGLLRLIWNKLPVCSKDSDRLTVSCCAFTGQRLPTETTKMVDMQRSLGLLQFSLASFNSPMWPEMKESHHLPLDMFIPLLSGGFSPFQTHARKVLLFFKKRCIINIRIINYKAQAEQHHPSGRGTK